MWQVGIPGLYPDRLMLIVAIVATWLVAPRWAWRLERIPPRRLLVALAMLTVPTFVVGHVQYLRNYPLLAAAGGQATLWLPWRGFHAGGAVIGLVAAIPVACLVTRIHPGRLMDALTPSFGLGIALARVGCFLRGCCHGARCDWPWCLRFPPGSPSQDMHAGLGWIPTGSWSLPVHPIGLYFAAAGCAILVLGLWLSPVKRYQGQVGLIALTLFGVSSYGIELLRQRTDLTPYVLGTVPQLQVVGLAIAAVGAGGLVLCEVGHRVWSLGRRLWPAAA